MLLHHPPDLSHSTSETWRDFGNLQADNYRNMNGSLPSSMRIARARRELVSSTEHVLLHPSASVNAVAVLTPIKGWPLPSNLSHTPCDCTDPLVNLAWVLSQFRWAAVLVSSSSEHPLLNILQSRLNGLDIAEGASLRIRAQVELP